MPCRGTRWGGIFDRSWPSNSIWPPLRATRPMMLRKVVVLPTPLRPSSAAHSPSFTSRSTPCRICSLAMCTWTLRRLSISSLLDIILVLGPAQIGFAHAFVGSDFLGIARRQNGALRHYGDRVGNVEHNRHIVLDDDDIDGARHFTNADD